MYDGILNIYKEKGYTSHDVVAKLRGILKQKKIGHTGTLDPEAEGVLPVCLGKATRLCDMMTDQSKTYEAVLLLGTETDTQDITGKILSSREVGIGEEALREIMHGFLGEYEQIPPMYSALKVNGKKLYELAREGRTVERKARTVVIHDLEISDIRLPRAEFSVTCSKGTYIRTLCHDIGEKAGCGGCMESLKRTRVGPFEARDSLTLGEVEALRDGESLSGHIQSIESFFQSFRQVHTLPQWDRLAQNGNPCPISCIRETSHCETDAFSHQEAVRLYDSRQGFVGVYTYQEDRQGFWPSKIFL